MHHSGVANHNYVFRELLLGAALPPIASSTIGKGGAPHDQEQPCPQAPDLVTVHSKAA